jgi:hypothetical protein
VDSCFHKCDQKAAQIIDELQGIIDRFKSPKAYRFQWNMKLYRFDQQLATTKKITDSKTEHKFISSLKWNEYAIVWEL